MNKLVVAICTFNGAKRLPKLINSLSHLECPVPFEILIINNNSSDNTQAVIDELAAIISIPLLSVIEREQGIPFARNRAIEKSLNSKYLLFIDDDELPHETTLTAAIDTLQNTNALCVGGKISINFSPYNRPDWLSDDLLPFYGQIDYGSEAFEIIDRTTPVWSGIVAYNMDLFRNNPDLRFDIRYNRKKKGVGGGEDGIMFRELLKRKFKIFYAPGMSIEHFIEKNKIKRSYFIKLHFQAGKKYGQFEMSNYQRELIGIPPFLIAQFFHQLMTTFSMLVKKQPGVIRQAMNASYALGSIVGKAKSHFQ